MTPIFAVSVHDIDAGGLARSFELPLAWLERALAETDVTPSGAGHADVRLSRTGSDVIVRGKVKATLTQPCARCLRPTTSDIEGELSLLLRPARHAHGGAAKDERSRATPAAGRPAGKEDRPSHGHARQAAHGNGAPRRRDEEEYEFTSEEADQDVYDGEVVVLDDFLREALLLEAPSFPLCSEDCPGIRPASRGAPRPEAVDPRLSPLRALKSRLKLAPSAGPAEQGATPGSRSRAPEEGAGSPPPGDVEQSFPGDVRQSFPGDVRQSFPGDVRQSFPGDVQSSSGAPDAPRPRKAARPRIHTHRTAGTTGAKGGSKKSRAKNSPSKKAR